jgi:ABC-2 type transport system permease protein
MTAFINHFLFEFKTGLRNSGAMLMLYLLPLSFYAVMGLVMVQINPMFVELLTPSMVVFTILSATILGLPNGFVEARDSGIYRSFKINCVPALSILSIPALSTITHALITSVVIALTATPFFGAIAPENWLVFFLITVISSFTFGTLGMLIGVISSNSRSVVLWSQLIYLPSILLGGMMIPTEMLPDTIQRFSGIIPSTYVMQSFFGLAYNQETAFNPLLSVVVLLVSGFFALFLSAYLFNWDSQNQSRRASPLLALLIFVPYIIAIFLS